MLVGVRDIFGGELCIICAVWKKMMHRYLHVCVCVNICISTNKQQKSQVLCFVKVLITFLSDNQLLVEETSRVYVAK